ncbi:hypothetical protein [Roseomonas marmotae]|uniref:Uncharacterized protein n=1 Tax=Roseomonas marmotae TaxID=2768161 RepID=A0ABS3K717_9PROT|nr:hypothetical protein [Roseomonas marmotae]MBO1073246.1 hypothetical protein [Roseomonas marmotae]QTI79130.1 hypothetical protein IAI58_16110 [Roseomonas marmotae]
MSGKAPKAASPKPSPRTARQPKPPAKPRKAAAARRPRKAPKLTARQAREAEARRAARRRFWLGIGDYALGLAMLAGALWWLANFLGRT